MTRPWLPLYCADYLTDTAHLSAEESGTYLGLLMLAWLKGPLRESVNRLAVAVKGRPSVVQSVLSEYWVQKEEGWINKRLEREREHAQEVSDKRRKAREGRTIVGAIADANVPLLQVQLSTQSQSQSQSHTQVTTEDLEIPHGISVDAPSAAPTKRGVNGAPYKDLVALYHELLVPPLPSVARISATRKQHMAARWADELPDLDSWRRYFGYVKASTRLPAGWTHQGRLWRPDFDWLINPTNLLKVEEGKYDR